MRVERVFHKTAPNPFKERSDEEIASLLEQLKSMPQLLPGVRETFGEENADVLESHLLGKDMQELDQAFILQKATSNKGLEEVYEYLCQLPEYRRLESERIQLVQSCFRFLLEHGNLEEKLKSQRPRISSDRKFVMRGRALKVVTGGAETVKNEIIKLTNKGISIFSQHQVKRVPAFRNEYIHNFYTELFALVFEYLESIDPKAFGHVRAYVSERFKRRNNGEEDPSIVLSNLLCQANSVLSRNPEGRQILFDSVEEESEEVLKQKNSEIFKEVEELSLFRKIEDTGRWFGDNVYVGLIPSNPTSVRREKAHTIAWAVIHFGNKEKFEREGGDISSNQRRVMKQVLSDTKSCFVHIERTTGELCYGATGIPLSTVLPSMEYEKLRHVILQMISDHLYSKDEDLDELVFAHHDEHLPGEVRALVQSGMTREKAKHVIQEQYGEYKPHEEEPEVVVPEEDPSIRIQHEEEERQKQLKREREAIQALVAYDALEVLNALKKIFGDPENIDGSHHVFRGGNGSRPFVFPFHHSGGEVKQGIIKSGCQKSGLSPLKLLEAVDDNHPLLEA